MWGGFYISLCVVAIAEVFIYGGNGHTHLCGVATRDDTLCVAAIAEGILNVGWPLNKDSLQRAGHVHAYKNAHICLEIHYLWWPLHKESARGMLIL